MGKESSTNKLKIINDPVYGFIKIPYDIVFDLIEHPCFNGCAGSGSWGSHPMFIRAQTIPGFSMPWEPCT